MTDRELLEMALEALEQYCGHSVILCPIERRDALRANLHEGKRMKYEPAKNVSTLTKGELVSTLYAVEHTVAQLEKEITRLQNIILELREKL